MSSSDHTGSIADRALGVIDNLKPLKKQKSPVIAAILGFFCGGIGLGLYFESWLDFFVPIAIWIVVAVIAIPTAEALDFLGLIFCCFYGYRRATTSNEKLEALNSQIIDVPVTASRIEGTPPPIRPIDTPIRTPRPLTAPTVTPAQTPPALQGAVEQRLQRLNDLRDKNMITQAEYDSKRQQILGEL